MQIMKINPNEKYVLVLPEMRGCQIENMANNLRSFLDDGVPFIFFICGEGVAIVPADQVVGYTTLERRCKEDPEP